jgi:hypothetical protein
MSLLNKIRRNKMVVVTYPCQICGRGGLPSFSDAHDDCKAELEAKLHAMETHA